MTVKNPGNQRKKMLHAPLHKKKRLVNVALSKDLRIQIKKRSLGIRKGDEVKIIKGKFRNTQGTITRVDVKDTKIYIDTAVIKKKSGGQVQVPVPAANMRITKLTTADKGRQKLLQIKV
ncbi:MAG: 50S ribosomal protein L24 [Candidatus Aenigmarchaeota archaeon]|nr:50S ribosomal protein L24 [Candidatus Aenigmarchaeota archaeon]